MKLIIVCFEYGGSKNSIDSVFSDMYFIIPLVKKVQESGKDVLVITDIVQSMVMYDSLNYLKDLYRDPERISFLKKMILEDSYFFNGRTSLIDILRNNLEYKSIFYFSGHIYKEHLIVPGNSKESLREIRNLLEEKRCSLFVDSCYAGEFLYENCKLGMFSSSKDEPTINKGFIESFTKKNISKFVEFLSDEENGR